MSGHSQFPSFATLLVAAPVLGLLFGFVPWEIDPRIQKVNRERAEMEKREAEERKEEETDATLTYEQRIRKLTEDAAIEQILKDRSNPNVVLHDGGSPLHHALHTIRSSGIERLAALLEVGADPNYWGEMNYPPIAVLMKACRTGPERAEFEKKCPDAFSVSYGSCRDRLESVKQARSEDIELQGAFKLLLSRGAKTDAPVPKTWVVWGLDQMPRDLPAAEYAQVMCPDFIVDMLK